MKTKAVLELADVKAIAATAEAEALKNQWAVTIAIVDDGGHLLWLQRLDGAAPVADTVRADDQLRGAVDDTQDVALGTRLDAREAADTDVGIDQRVQRRGRV